MEEQNPNPSGNIWGWKISTIGLIVIGLLLAIMIYRHKKLGVPFGQLDPAPVDTTHQTY